MLYEGQTEDVILTYCADLMGYNLDEYGVSGIMYQSNGTAGAFVKLADALGIQWLALGDNDQQGIKTRKEIRKCGYSEAETLNKVILTNVKDIEHEFANTGFLADYETILQDDITEDMKSLKANGDMEKYKKEIVAMIQKGKVENAYKLVENWKKRGMEVSEIPEFLADFIKRVCLDE
jgi:putative ATP-dependent endonuclease of OLD family